MEGLDKETLLSLLQLNETALTELRQTDDPSVSGLILRREKHRAEVVAALANTYMPTDE